MEIKFLKIGSKYIIYDCSNDDYVGKECEIFWEQVVDLERYFYCDEKGCIYDINSGAPVGYLEVIEE
ncbi:MAG: hypothetical protein NC921_04025 [Candidatus Omnitrophica bacterium]|nr:hypothetical protein [Candidatus Omnitrophota bacterium]